jgi:SNF2 family DNA or RNA helicase
VTDLLLPDPVAQRAAAAWQVHEAADVSLPHLEFWNYDPCKWHQEWTDLETGELKVGVPKPDCEHMMCGVRFRKHQRVGISWLYFAQRGLLADAVGTGKTIHAAGLLALMKQREELSHNNRAVIVMRPAGLMQFQAQMARCTKHIPTMVAVGTSQQRIDRYLAPWEVGLIGHQMLLQDLEKVLAFEVSTIIVDDVDALRNRENRTAAAIKRVARDCERTIVMTGTPLQKKLHEMHSVLEPLGGREVFGSELEFRRRYIRSEAQTVYDRKKGRRRNIIKVVGYKNVNEFKRLLGPMALRRTAEDLDDVDMPVINAAPVYLDLYPAQRTAYNELRRGVMQIINEQGHMVTQATAMAKVHTGAKICAGLAAVGLPDTEGSAVKLDWIMQQVEDGGDLEAEKVVVFINYKDTIRALQKRLTKAGIGFETVWGEERDKVARWNSQQRFWKDPTCRLLIGTTAIEQSLNLQIARHLINVDMILNPARMTQLAGRIQRDGSAFKHVFVHNLLCIGTQEEKYLALLEREQALIDYVWDENSELFEKVSPLTLLQLIAS